MGKLVAVIDYGLGNLRSVSRALESVGGCADVTGDPARLSKAHGLVMPGVGAFYHGIRNIRDLNLVDAIRENINEGKPFLGICLGLQLLFTETEEHGRHKGLNIIKGKVLKFPAGPKIPHMGWNSVRLEPDNPAARLFMGIPDGSYFYFVHSYYVQPENADVIAARTEYGIEFVAAVARDNVYATQFHPEKSSTLGLKVMENFVSLC